MLRLTWSNSRFIWSAELIEVCLICLLARLWYCILRLSYLWYELALLLKGASWGGSCALWTLTWGGIPGTSDWEETTGQTWIMLEGFYIPSGPWMSRDPSGSTGGCGEEEGRGWMNGLISEIDLAQLKNRIEFDQFQAISSGSSSARCW